MATHLIAWTESQDSAALVPVNTVRDDIVTQIGVDRFRVPSDYKNIYAAAALGVDLTRAQIVAPSLEVVRATQEIIPHERGDDTFTLDGPRYFKPMRDIELDPFESLEFQAAEDGAGATRQYGLVWLKQPGNLPPVPEGPIIYARATSTQTLTANLWTTGSMTLEKELQAGQYACVGFLPSSATLIAARLLIPGQVYRPGVPGQVGAEEAARDFHPDYLEDFAGYEMGRFSNEAIPEVQFLASAADAAEVVIFLLVKVG